MAQEDDDDWDNEKPDSQAPKQNIGGITFYNRGPAAGSNDNSFSGQGESKLSQFEGKANSYTMGGAKASSNAPGGFKGPQKGGFMQANDAEDFDRDDWDKPKGGAAIGYKPSSGIGGG